jgi:hypothetical protein
MKITQLEITQVLQAVHLFARILHCMVFFILCMYLVVLVGKALHFIDILLAWKAMQLLIRAILKLSKLLSQEIMKVNTDI